MLQEDGQKDKEGFSVKTKGFGQRLISMLLVFSIVIAGIGIPVKSKAAETYMVFFDSQGGSYCQYITDIPENTKITLPTPTKEGYIFGGWYEDADYTNQFSSWETVTTSMLLYAKWNKKPIRTAKAEYIGDPVVINNAVDKKDIVVTVTFSDGTTAILDEEEYFLQNDFYDTVGEKYVSVYYRQDNYDRYLCNVKVKFVKETVHCIGFDTMGGSAVAPITGIAPNSTISLPEKPTKKGYVFDGWYLEKNYVTKFTGEEKITKTFIVYAKWIKESEVSEEDKPYSEELTLNASVINVAVGATEAVIVNTMDPNLEVWYDSSNSDVVMVDDNGIITGIKNGRATIYAYVVDEGIELKCKVGVGNRPYITKIEPKKESKKVMKGDTYQIKLKVEPKKIDKSNITYTTSDWSIASVNAKGVVKAKKRGTCYITVKTTDGGNLKEKIRITVY